MKRKTKIVISGAIIYCLLFGLIILSYITTDVSINLVVLFEAAKALFYAIAAALLLIIVFYAIIIWTTE